MIPRQCWTSRALNFCVVFCEIQHGNCLRFLRLLLRTRRTSPSGFVCTSDRSFLSKSSVSVSDKPSVNPPKRILSKSHSCNYSDAVNNNYISSKRKRVLMSNVKVINIGHLESTKLMSADIYLLMFFVNVFPGVSPWHLS